MRVERRFYPDRNQGTAALTLTMEREVPANPRRLWLREKGHSPEWPVMRVFERDPTASARHVLGVGETVSIIIAAGCHLGEGDQVDLVDRPIVVPAVYRVTRTIRLWVDGEEDPTLWKDLWDFAKTQGFYIVDDGVERDHLDRPTKRWRAAIEVRGHEAEILEWLERRSQSTGKRLDVR